MTEPNETKVREIRCASCNRLLAKGRALAISIKCPRCKNINTFTDTDRRERPPAPPATASEGSK